MLTARPGADPLRVDTWVKSPQPVFHPSAVMGVCGTGHNGFTTSPDAAKAG